MKVRATLAIPYRLPLKTRWRSHGHDFRHRDGWLVALATENGLCGWGDAAPLTDTTAVPPAIAGNRLRAAGRALTGTRVADGLQALSPAPDMDPAIRCALETALLDLSAQQAGVPLAEHLHPGAATEVAVNANLGDLTRDRTADARRAVAQGYSTLKLKVGIMDPDQELRALRRLTQTLAAPVRLRLDANRAWSFDTAARFLAGIDNLPVEFIEEPLCRPDVEDLQRLRSVSRCALALDESITRLGAEAILASRPVALLVLKPMWLGGLRPCLELARRAARVGIRSLVTTTVDSAIGTWAAIHLAAALPPADAPLAHGLATSSWLREDLAVPPRVNAGRIALSRRPGLGCSPGREVFAYDSDGNIRV